LQQPEMLQHRGSTSRSSFFGSTFGFNLERDVEGRDKKKEDREETNKKLPIINPMVIFEISFLKTYTLSIFFVPGAVAHLAK
jgi:hypothetical protein